MAKTAKKAKLNIRKPLLKMALPTMLAVAFLSLALSGYQLFLADKYPPRTFLGDTNVSFLTKAQAAQILNLKFAKRASEKLAVNLNDQQFTIDLATSSASLDYQIINQAFQSQHPSSLLDSLKTQLQSLLFKKTFDLPITLNLDKQIEPIAEAVYQKPVNAQLVFNETTTSEGSPSAQIQTVNGKSGLKLNTNKLDKQIKQFLAFGSFPNQSLMEEVNPKVSDQQVKLAKQALETSQKEPVILKFQDQTWLIDTKQLLTILDLTSGGNLLLDKNQTLAFLGDIASEIDQPVQEGQFEFNPDTKRVSTFKPSQEGRKLDKEKTFELLTQSYSGKIGKTIGLPVAIVKPKTLTEDVNNLGIRELIGQGISYFAGSATNRIYNIALTASKINGVLVAPGETFSFNNTVGDISAATGYKQAYVIKEGRTVLDDGGGVCQDSTTLFRAVLNAGLPVVKRTAHAYRVGYYEQGFPPGLDATVYYPSVDFQFKNDTPTHILIQAYTQGVTLFVNLYGTSDGRVSKISRSIVTNQTPPPPDLRQDDPTLPKGVVKQVDFAAWGANVSFQRTVTRGTETLIKETWYSNYRPWQAVYLVGIQ